MFKIVEWGSLHVGFKGSFFQSFTYIWSLDLWGHTVMPKDMGILFVSNGYRICVFGRWCVITILQFL